VFFLAIVYFVVGQAAVIRNSAQTAADAAALAAAQDARDQLWEGWGDVVLDPAHWGRFIEGEAYETSSACQRAADLATRNDAELLAPGCEPQDLGFTVTVQTRRTVGESIVPGTERRRGVATATAVIEPRCSIEGPEATPVPDLPEEPEPTPSPSEDAVEEPAPVLRLVCDTEVWEIDPEDPNLPGATDLFRVRLTGDE
jgi:hypothetical protein